MLHSLGFFHEQNRFDREDFVVVNWENIREGQAPQFFKNRDPENPLQDCDEVEGPIYDNCDNGVPGETYGTPYDYSSIMHYGRDL